MELLFFMLMLNQTPSYDYMITMSDGTWVCEDRSDWPSWIALGNCQHAMSGTTKMQIKVSKDTKITQINEDVI